jgi:predicted amidohydrolase
MNIIKAGFIQFAPILGRPAGTLEIVRSLIEGVAAADLVVLPELANSGYNFISAKQAYQLAEQESKSEFIDFLVAFARQKNLNIVTGFNERSGKDLYNSSLLITPSGIQGKYRKIHLFMNEKSLFKPGNLGLPLFDLGFARMGMQICFDYIFPETWRVFGLKGADIVCHPSNLITPYPHKVLPAQALMNRLFIITANRIGTEGELTFSGASVINDPEGDTILRAPKDRNAVMVINLDIDMARNKMITAKNHVFKDRFPEHYTGLLDD